MSIGLELKIMEILEIHSNSRNPIYQRDIQYYLWTDYGMNIHRHTLAVRLSYLRDEGYVSGSRGYYLKGKLDESELRAVIDCILYGRQFSVEVAREIIEKLCPKQSIRLKGKMMNIQYLQDISRSENEYMYAVLDELDEAIGSEKRVLIVPCTYTIFGSFKDKPAIIVDPYFIVSDKSRYYLICGTNEHGLQIENRRIDRIRKVSKLDETRIPAEHYNHNLPLDMRIYLKEHIYMFAGESINIRLEVKKHRIGDFIDWFGKDYHIEQDSIGKGDSIAAFVQSSQGASACFRHPARQRKISFRSRSFPYSNRLCPSGFRSTKDHDISVARRRLIP